MKKYRLIINIIVVIIVLIIMHHYLVPSTNEYNCIRDIRFKSLDINGVVIDKYYDETNHSYPTIDIKTLDNVSIQKINLFGEESNLFYLLQISDTIRKDKFRDIVMRKRNGTYTKLVKVDFDCKDSVNEK